MPAVPVLLTLRLAWQRDARRGPAAGRRRAVMMRDSEQDPRSRRPGHRCRSGCRPGHRPGSERPGSSQQQRPQRDEQRDRSPDRAKARLPARPAAGTDRLHYRRALALGVKLIRDVDRHVAMQVPAADGTEAGRQRDPLEVERRCAPQPGGEVADRQPPLARVTSLAVDHGDDLAGLHVKAHQGAVAASIPRRGHQGGRGRLGAR